MKKKGFTLIELLAVIIILAIIALIATPIVLNVIEESRESGRQSSVAMYANAVRLRVTEDWFKNGSYPSIDSAYLNTVSTQGEKVTCEEVKYSEKYEAVLHKCTVGDNTKEYYFAGNKVYDNAEDEEYKKIYASLSGEEEEPGTPTNLTTILKKQYNTSNTVGLLKDDTGYYYKGTKEEVSNNFVWFAGHLWRVISIDNDNNLTMITQQPVTALQSASKVWTTQANYEASYINYWLNSETDGVFYKSLTSEDKAKILNSTFNIGIYTNVSEIITTQKVGLLDESQYTKAGGANSFLDIKDNFWLGNRYSTSHVRSVGSNGNLDYNTPTNAFGVRPVIKISNLTFTAGKGTLDDPYRESSTTTNTSNIKVGEYVSISTTSETYCGEDKRCLFRVVSKDNNSIKVTLNGLLPSTSAFGSTVTYTNGNTIDAVVTKFANTINVNYRYNKIAKTFGIGTYPSVSGTGQDYKMVQNTKYTGNVGLPVIGEMFTANDIDMTTGSAAKRFVNVSIIENSTVSGAFWAMNAHSTSNVRIVSGTGGLSSNNSTYLNGVRPVLFLNQGLTFTSGDGTAEHPFMLGE